MTASRRRRFPLAIAVLAVAGLLGGVAIAPGAGLGAPEAPTTAPPGDEGGTPLLRDVLDSAGRGYVAAKNAVDQSKRRQAQLATELAGVDRQIAALTPEVGAIAASAYRTGRVGPLMLLLENSSPDTFLERAIGLEQMAVRDDGKLRELDEAKTRVTRAKAALDAELGIQRKQLAVMDKRKKEAERAIALVGGKSTGGFVVARSPVARQAPRNSDGSWSTESCSLDDPTTTGCITPRLKHALTETKRLGFTRFVSCFRPGGPFEHPKGRACDFSAEPKGFGGDAKGANKIYGNNLAAFFVRNSDKLGILYVIWYRQIWFPATGWKSYSGAHGDPSSDHTNHVHLSVL